MRKTTLALCLALLSTASTASNKEKDDIAAPSLPVSYEKSFTTAMNNPHVILYYGQKAYEQGEYAEALRWMLAAAEYQLPAAIDNSKFMISKNMGVEENRKEVINFLEFLSQDRAEHKGDTFAQLYLADFYRGDTCVWDSNKTSGECNEVKTSATGPRAALDFKRSYFFYNNATDTNDRAMYHAAMMDLLGIGVPRNVPFAISRLATIAEKGNTSVAFLLGEIHQNGYWVNQNYAEATKWYSKAKEKAHPGATMKLAENVYRGILSENVKERTDQALALYLSVTESLLASDAQRAEAFYRAGVISELMSESDNYWMNYLEFSAALGEAQPNEYSVMAYHKLGKLNEQYGNHHDLYDKGIEVFDKLDAAAQQRQASILQSKAQAYSTDWGGGEGKFSIYMNRYHRVMAAPVLNANEPHSLFGFHAFVFPG